MAGAVVGDVSVQIAGRADSTSGASYSGGATYFGNSGSGGGDFLSLPTSPNSLMIIGGVIIAALIVWKVAK